MAEWAVLRLCHHIWESVSKPHSSTLNIEVFLYGTSVVRLWYIAAGVAGSAGQSYRIPLLPPYAPIYVD